MRIVPRQLIPVIGALAVIANPSSGSAQQPLFDSAAVRHDGSAMCHLYASYTVIVRERQDALGSDIFVRPPAQASCAADSLPGDYVFRNEWAEYFLGLRGDYLVLDSGTGPDLRGLIIIDLRTRRRVFQGSYVELEIAPSPELLGVWQGYELETPRAGCQTTPGLVPGVDSLVWLDLRTGRTRFAGQVRCAQRQ